MKKVMFIIVFLHTVILLFSLSTPDQAAQEKLNQFIQSIPTSQLEDFGFSNATEPEQVKIEPCFRMFSLSESRIKQWYDKQQFNDLLSPDSLHLYPLSVNNHYKCMLAVDFTKGEWKAVSIGYRDLAQQIDLIRQTWSGNDVRIIRVLPLQRYYFSVSNASFDNCTRIQFNQNSKPVNYINLTSMQDALNEMYISLDKDSSTGANHEN